MARRLIYLLLTAYAIAFAFGAMTAVRWPSIVMVLGWIVTDDVIGGLNALDWRELGITHGGAYLLASVCYYASGATLAARKPGAVLWYVMGLAASIPAVFLVHFDPDWWLDPSAGEGALAGLVAGALLLFVAVWELRWRPARPVEDDADETPPQQVIVYQPAPVEEAVIAVRRRREPMFVPDIVVARQRAAYAAHARRKAARRRAHQEFAEEAAED